MFGIHINAKEKSVYVTPLDQVIGQSAFDAMKATIGVDIAEPVHIADGVTLWLDEEGRLKSEQVWFKWDNVLFAGSGLIVIGNYERPTAAELATAQRKVSFVDAEQLDEDEMEPDCGFIGSLEEMDAAIAAGKVPASMRSFFE